MCGIFGIYNHPEASNHTYLGLYALQHRGQESAGIVSSDNRQLHHYKQMGLVSEAFTKDILKRLLGKVPSVMSDIPLQDQVNSRMLSLLSWITTREVWPLPTTAI